MRMPKMTMDNYSMLERMKNTMAITVSEIREKIFTEVEERKGYDIDEVDSFLDELADQLAGLIRENMALNDQISELEGKLVETQARVPDYNESDYFQNLQSAMRETLIGAQRIADDTIDEANQKAAKLVSDAQLKADRVTSEAQIKADALVSDAQSESDRITGKMNAEIETLDARLTALKASAKEYKAGFAKLIETQSALMRENADLF